MAHLLEEITAKDTEIQQCRNVINEKDSALQKHVRSSETLVKHPKEDLFTKTVLANYGRMDVLQAGKVALSTKAMLVLERHIKRLDTKIRDLQVTDQFPQDPSLPSLLHPSAANSAPPLSAVGSPLPMSPLASAQIGGAPNMANAAMARVAGAQATRGLSPVAAVNPMLSHLTPTGARSSREASLDPNKRRRLNSTLSGTIPTQSSSLRQSSLGPMSSPKATTPASARAGSIQYPRNLAGVRKLPSRRVPPHEQAILDAAKAAEQRMTAEEIAEIMKQRPLSPLSANPTRAEKKRYKARYNARLIGTPSPDWSKSRRTGQIKNLGRYVNKPLDASDDDDDDELSNEGDLDDETRMDIDSQIMNASTANRLSGVSAGNDEEDSQTYCVCQRVSFGDMVACDNEQCAIQWFHWGCVGLREEPAGEWLCPDCRTLPAAQISRA